MPTGNPSGVELQKSIIEMVDQHWNETKSAMLLTAMGSQIRRFFPNSSELMPDGLKEFIKQNNLAQLVTHPEVPAKVGAVPAGVHVSADVENFFSPEKI